MSSSISMALILYTQPKTSMEFIRSEVERGVANGTISSLKKLNGITIALPEQVENLEEALFPFHRKIESQYRALPWPASIQKIVVLTDVKGGSGDVVAAAKAIALMQRICPTLTFDWVLKGSDDPSSFLNCQDTSKVSIRYWGSTPSKEDAGDFLLTGPVKLGWGIDYIESRISRKIAGPIFGFMENAEGLRTFDRKQPTRIVKRSTQEDSLNKIYQELHQCIFPSKSDDSEGLLPMGIRPGIGVFLDRSRIEASLSRGYCCPSYLSQIKDAKLRKDILEAMNIFDGQSQPDYDRYSFNFGYAHYRASWGKFIDCVAIHEKNKHVVIVLNQRGAVARLSTREFQDQIFDEERLMFLKRKGYGTIIFKGQDQEDVLLQQVKDSRSLTVIVRPSFTPNDMRQIQLASERLLATGDNSAVEAWCARCKLYLYEDVANGGCKWRFLQQQVDLAQTISPNLSKLLALFGGDRRLSDHFPNKPLSSQKMEEIEQLLNDPHLSTATLQFCEHITSNYSFDEVFEAAIKRTVWHHCIPELAKIEGDTLDEGFRTGLVAYLKNPEASEKVLHVKNMLELGKRVREVVQRAAK